MKNDPIRLIILLLFVLFPKISAAACIDPDSTPHQKQLAPPQWKIDGLLTALEDSCEDTRAVAVADLGYLLYDTEFPVETISPVHLKSIARFLKSQDKNVRGNAARTLGRMGNHAISMIPQIIPLLGDDDFNVGNSAADAIRMFCADAEPFVSDIAVYLKDPRENVRRIALMALGNMGEYARKAIPEIAPFLNDPSFLAHTALDALTKIPVDSTNLMPAVEPYLHSKSVYTRKLAVQFMGNMGNEAKDYSSQIISLLKYDSQSKEDVIKIRGTVAEAIDKIGIYDSLMRSAVIELLQDSSIYVRWAAVAVCRNAGLKLSNILPDIISLFDNSAPEVRSSALYAISEFKNNAQPFTGKIAAHLKDSNADVRKAAVIALGTIGDSSQQYIPEILRLMKDTSPGVRQSAVYCLDSLLGLAITEYAPSIAALLHDENPNVRVAAAMTLARMGAAVQPYISEMVPLLSHDILNFFGSGNISAAFSLMGEYAGSAVPLIIDLYRNGEIDLRKAISTLARMEKAVTKHIPAIAMMLKDTSTDCRHLALELLGSIGKQAEAYVPEIAAQLSDIDSDIRSDAIRTLKAIGGKAVSENLPIFAIRINDRSENVSRAACQAFRGAGEAVRPYLPFFITLLSDSTVETDVYIILTNSTQFDHPLVCKLLEENHEYHFYNSRYLSRLTAGSDKENQLLISMLGNPCRNPAFNFKDTIECNTALFILEKTLHICDSLQLINLRNDATESVIITKECKKRLCRTSEKKIGAFGRVWKMFFQKK